MVVPRVQGPGLAKLWNALPSNIHRIDTLGSFMGEPFVCVKFDITKHIHDANPFLYRFFYLFIVFIV